MRLADIYLLISLVVLIGLSLARRDFDGAPPGLSGGFIPPGQAKKMAKFSGMGDGRFGGRGAGPPGECKLHRASLPFSLTHTHSDHRQHVANAHQLTAIHGSNHRRL